MHHLKSPPLEPLRDLVARLEAGGVEGRVVRIPTVVSRRWRGLPVGSPEAWAVAYGLMDRPQKSEWLFAWLATGPDPVDGAVIGYLLAQPLPVNPDARLRTLASSNA